MVRTERQTAVWRTAFAAQRTLEREAEMNGETLREQSGERVRRAVEDVVSGEGAVERKARQAAEAGGRAWARFRNDCVRELEERAGVRRGRWVA